VCSPQEVMVQKGINRVPADMADYVIQIHVWPKSICEQLHQVCRRKTKETENNNVAKEGGNNNSMQVSKVLYVGEVSRAEVYKEIFWGHQQIMKTWSQ
jgi:hypothetical protein